MTTHTKWTDPIIDEVRRVRQELVRESGGDVASLGKWLQSTQARHGDRLVAPSSGNAAPGGEERTKKGQ